MTLFSQFGNEYSEKQNERLLQNSGKNHSIFSSTSKCQNLSEKILAVSNSFHQIYDHLLRPLSGREIFFLNRTDTGPDLISGTPLVLTKRNFECLQRHSDNSYQATTLIRRQLISIWKGDNSYQALIYINMEKATTHIKFANRLQIPKFYFKNKLLTNIINCN